MQLSNLIILLLMGHVWQGPFFLIFVVACNLLQWVLTFVLGSCLFLSFNGNWTTRGPCRPSFSNNNQTNSKISGRPSESNTLLYLAFRKQHTLPYISKHEANIIIIKVATPRHLLHSDGQFVWICNVPEVAAWWGVLHLHERDITPFTCRIRRHGKGNSDGAQYTRWPPKQ